MKLDGSYLPSCLISHFDARKFGGIFVFAILKTNPFSHHLSIVQLHSKFGLLALFCISLKRVERSFLKSLHIIFIMYIIMSETFIKIDSLQHNFKTKLSYELLKNPRYYIHSFDVMLIFPN